MEQRETPRRGPGRPRRDERAATRESILLVAVGLFARHGFAAVSLRQVAEAAGVDVATVHHHTGGKAALYEACFGVVFAAERAALAPVLEDARLALPGGADAVLPVLHRLVDTFVDFLEAHPENTGLWLRRWLDPAGHEGLDERYSAPLYGEVARLLAAADAAGILHEPAPHTAVRSLIWALHAHAVQVLHEGPDADRQRAVRTFAHRWLRRMYGAA
ncbi:TetR/AcrR family transcriptional regulator [Dactylosporangium matsuzakiense]|uniref:TetR family transcriptional regulator n=1 Tax=Dactylosporangium matsuzakiense TaxID=53360 RepID=A0A9W6NLE1_9ACTN|nr:TetR/AcrR family transcriptional regulator [Dactylosporangium matsuzakiense]UWZ48833.1 TetR/AcrR family transcriptional regulator [Dactylosporangium matsuzakiense]GLL01061.1 TetR family transcriptional regulator [Dactylosporangium matsuzakiense]